MTETSPASFMTEATDSMEQRLETVGRVFPHVSAKVVDSENRIVPCGVRGELCVSGWLLQKGYFNNPEKTAEVMVPDDNGVLWMHTGDEATIDEAGYCRITGRIKDIIIRGEWWFVFVRDVVVMLTSGIAGENIYPLEIEERLLEHPSISHAAVVGVKDDRYGEAVAAFLQVRPGAGKIPTDDLRQWVREGLGRHKAPSHIFWVGLSEMVRDFPLTGNGKYQKEAMRALGNSMLSNANAPVVAKL